MVFVKMIRLLNLGLVCLVFFLTLTLVFAQETSPLPSASPTPVEYSLPFPGILPDHPLYFLKNLRDKILLLLISDPVRKVEFKILLADKHLNMGLFLLDKKPDLALKTISQGADYLTLAKTDLFKIAPGEIGNISDLKGKFERSIQKHKQTLVTLETNLSDENKQRMQQIIKEIDKLYQDFSLNK